jgi:hypothetical protein
MRKMLIALIAFHSFKAGGRAPPRQNDAPTAAAGVAISRT